MDDTDGSGWLVAGSTDPGEVAERYDRWAAAYDGDLDAWGYGAPDVVAAHVGDGMPEAERVLDAGCGTGLVGRALRAAGYRGELHGVDVSRSSLEVAAASGAYTSLAAADLQRPLALRDGGLDAVTCVGVMTYVPDVEGLWRELARVVRPGGLVVATQREDLWEERGCRAVVERMLAGGGWSSVAVEGPAPYLPGNPDGMAEIGVVYVAARVA